MKRETKMPTRLKNIIFLYKFTPSSGLVLEKNLEEELIGANILHDFFCTNLPQRLPRFEENFKCLFCRLSKQTARDKTLSFGESIDFNDEQEFLFEIYIEYSKIIKMTDLDSLSFTIPTFGFFNCLEYRSLKRKERKWEVLVGLFLEGRETIDFFTNIPFSTQQALKEMKKVNLGESSIALLLHKVAIKVINEKQNNKEILIY